LGASNLGGSALGGLTRAGTPGAALRCGVTLVALLAAAAGLAGCGSISESVAERASDLPGVGLPANAPARPATPAVYPAVHDMPPARPAALMNEAEVQRTEDDLVAVRNRHRAAAGLPAIQEPAKAKGQPQSQPQGRQNPPGTSGAVPGPSSRTIY
jgi:hypothetical protein